MKRNEVWESDPLAWKNLLIRMLIAGQWEVLSMGSHSEQLSSPLPQSLSVGQGSCARRKGRGDVSHSPLAWPWDSQALERVLRSHSEPRWCLRQQGGILVFLHEYPLTEEVTGKVPTTHSSFLSISVAIASTERAAVALWMAALHVLLSSLVETSHWPRCTHKHFPTKHRAEQQPQQPPVHFPPEQPLPEHPYTSLGQAPFSTWKYKKRKGLPVTLPSNMHSLNHSLLC